MFIRQEFDSLSDEVHKKVVCTVRDFILVIVEGIIDIQADETVKISQLMTCHLSALTN